MTRIRSLIFMAWLYVSMAVLATMFSPTLLMPWRWSMMIIKLWARAMLWGLRWICGVKVEMRGGQWRPDGPALIAAKHQGMLDVIAPFTFLDAPCFVLKKELMYLPFFGWYAWKTGMIPVDRSAGASALKQMVVRARQRLAEGRQILIFPEGTRTLPGQPAEYKPGVAALYRDLERDCVPMATNSGLHWPAHGIDRTPGTVVFEFLPVIPGGLKRPEFMRQLQDRIETASTALLGSV
jgi:1-acyl-sn-glycerol-3-phosphate acyltransferase